MIENDFAFGPFLQFLDANVIKVATAEAFFGRPSHVWVEFQHFEAELLKIGIDVYYRWEPILFICSFGKHKFHVGLSITALDE